MTKKLSFDIPEPLSNGQCNPKCRFFVKTNICIGDDGICGDLCDMGYGWRKRVKLEHPVCEIYKETLFPYKGCPWYKG